MSARLFIVEGLPGSGKSTAAKLVYELLVEKGIEAELYSEGNLDHPADYDGVAYFDEKDFRLLEESHPESKAVLNEIKIKHDTGYLIPYMKAVKEQKISFEDDIFNVIIKNDIYELPLEQHTRLILDRWSNFVDSRIVKDGVAVFECCFIQNPVTVSMIRSNAAKAFTLNYTNSLAEIIKPLKPVLIYIDQRDIRSSFCKVIPERPKQWLEGFTNYYTNQGYGLAMDLKGLEGVMQVLEARNALESEIFDSLKLAKYKINNSAFNLASLKDRINSIISANI